ncbi:MAG: hypothetical protein GY857_14585 [Desulfobacula sp.]|nr:hypothetical protein [Desulfobacula sp.]
MLLFGCSEPEKNITQFLIKTEVITISSMDFSEELDLKRAAYPYDIKENQEEYNEMVISLVKILSEEIVLLTAAVAKNITITEQEALAAEKEFKKDYPEDSFEQILLENAISYPLWKKRFKKNMIMEKLIDLELTQKIEISPGDIVDFYNSHNAATIHDSKNQPAILNKIENEKELVTRLRMQKTQDNYNKWIQELYKVYPVEINKDKLKIFLIDIKGNKEEKNDKK